MIYSFLPNFIQSLTGMNIRNNSFISSSKRNFIFNIWDNRFRLMFIDNKTVILIIFVWNHSSNHNWSRSLNAFNSFNSFSFLLIYLKIRITFRTAISGFINSVAMCSTLVIFPDLTLLVHYYGLLNIQFWRLYNYKNLKFYQSPSHSGPWWEPGTHLLLWSHHPYNYNITTNCYILTNITIGYSRAYLIFKRFMIDTFSMTIMKRNILGLTIYS
jgi:hypothetical protein